MLAEDDARVAAEDAERAFIAFYRAEYPAAVRIADALAGRTACEDVVQDAFLRLSLRFAELENPAGYLRVVVVNLCRDEHRRRARERDRLPKVSVPVADVSESARELLDVLGRLPYRYRAVLVLRFLADWTEREIADALGCRPGTVKSRCARGLALLRKELES